VPQPRLTPTYDAFPSLRSGGLPRTRAGYWRSIRPSISNDTISALGRAAHDVGVGAMIGGNLFARVGMHPALREVSDPRERGSATNTAWRRYGVVNALALGSVLVGWVGARLDEASPRMLSPRERKLAVAKDAAVGAACRSLTGARRRPKPIPPKGAPSGS
jgi:hypothetical protein